MAHRLTAASLWQLPRWLLSIPLSPGLRVTRKKRWNMWRSRYEMLALSERLRSFPTMLMIQATNSCDLRCPACHVGVGDVGRVPGSMPLELYRGLLRELGDYLFWIEFSGWGEPLLADDIHTMIREAVLQGISTLVSTNLNTPLDRDGAERLVSSRLHILHVPIAGARSESHAKYRIGGNLTTVLRNCREIAEARKRLGSETPYLRWEYLIFDYNEQEIDSARTQAAELGIGFELRRGWVAGADRTSRDAPLTARPLRFDSPCPFLWQRAVVNGDGGVSPCWLSFSATDDMGRVAVAGQAGSSSFREIWNGRAFRQARSLFRSRYPAAGQERRICTDCSVRTDFLDYVDHRESGLPAESFERQGSENDSFNYFWDWNRRRQQDT